MENGKPALAHLRVLDLSRLFPGPYATMMLADLGASVIKVEPPGEGDYMRSTPPLADGESTFFANLNRNKSSLCLDLKNPSGPAVLKRLVESADILVESFRPGVMDRLGVGYETLREINPGLVYCTITGYGNEGPLAMDAGHDLNYLAISGLLGQLKDREGHPIVPNIQIADVGGGALHAVIGMLAAITAREVTGKGRRVDISMTDTLAPWLVYPWAHLQAAGRIPGSTVLGGSFPCYTVYKTGDGGFIALAAMENKFWKAFCLRIDRPHWIELQYTEGVERDAIFAELRTLFLSRSRQEWTELLEDADCCATPVLELDELADHPHWRARNLSLPGAAGARWPGALAPAMTLGGPVLTRPVPALGGDTVEILREAGFGESEVEELLRAGAVHRNDAG